MKSIFYTNNLYILGAGFDKAVHNESPLNDELMARLSLSYELNQWINKHLEAKDNIELLLTYLDLDSRRQPELLEYRKVIEKALVSVFRQYRLTVSDLKPWMESFAKAILQQDDAVVNLNYGCSLEGMLDHFEVWSPIKGYSQFCGNWAAEIGDSGCGDNNCAQMKNIQIYKVHGSEHFEETYDLQQEQETYIQPLIDKTLFPKSSAHSWFETGIGKKKTKGYIIAPSYIKKPHVQMLYMMDEVLCRARLAKSLIIMGCGLRAEDQFLWHVICAFLNQDKPLKENAKRIVIVDPNAKNLQKNIQSYFSNMQGFFQQADRSIAFSGKIEEKMEELKNVLN
ncbi:MAG: hypothetical protein HGA87_02235 [Desulfobulbaceae bacterium]|nr:hypothetical protein [Desulfobulbaceae bacterium]